MLAELLNNFEKQLARIKKDPDGLLNDWKSRCRMIGEKISIISEEKTKYGIFDDIDDNGFLMLNSNGKIERIHYGDVSLG